MRVAHGVYAQQQFLERRVENARQRIEDSLKAPEARGVVVGVCQMRNCCDGLTGKERNLARMIAAMELAAGEGVQVLVFPEMCLPGYFVTEHGTAHEAVASTHALADVVGESAFLQTLQDAARQREMVISFGFCHQVGDRFYNAAGVVDADGTWLGTRHKNPLSPGPYDLEPFTEPPAAERSVVLNTSYAPVGISICFDGEFPESVRHMRLQGAELLLWSNAGTGDATTGSSTRFSQCGSYAQTNRMWVASCNAVGGSFYGNSCIYAPWGEPLVQLPHDQEALGVATINLALCGDWPMWRDRVVFEGRKQGHGPERT